MGWLSSNREGGQSLPTAVPDRSRDRNWLLPVALPAGIFLLLHLLARLAPSALWGADSLVYYGPLVTALFIAVPLACLTLPRTIFPAAVRGLVPRLIHQACTSRWFALALFLGSLPLFWLVRVETHTLGDSIKWFAVVGNAVEQYRPFSEIPWHNASLDLPGLEFINFQQALDLVIHVGAYWLLYAAGLQEPNLAYEGLSIFAGGLYLVALWSLARRLSESLQERLAVFGLFASLGTLQLFCGYGESYTLVTLLCAVYLNVALDSLCGSRPLWQPTVVLLLAVSTHMLALSLVPSLGLIVWYHPYWGALLRQPRVYLPLGIVGGIVGTLGYVGFYHGLQLPLLTADAPGRYPLLSFRHMATLGNALLLACPFGLLWGLAALLKRSPATPERRLLGVASGGAMLLIGVHDITMGGRDWDLMSFPALMVAAWGVVCLRQIITGPITRPLARIAVPVMVLHTLLWIGVNASSERSAQRLENLLLGDTNQATHYRNWALGFHYLEQTEGRLTDAAAAFERALASAPVELLNTPGTREFSYRKFYGGTLVLLNRDAEALPYIREAYRLQPEPYAESSDITFHSDWSHAAFRLGEAANARGDTAEARALWQESRMALERLVEWTDSPRVHHDLAVALRRLGHHEEAIEQRYLGIEPEQDAVAIMLELGDVYLRDSERHMAALAYSTLLSGGNLEVADYVRIGIRLHKSGEGGQAILAFRQALALNPASEEAHRNLVWLLLLNGDGEAAIPHLRRAIELQLTPEGLFTLAFAYLNTGQTSKAKATYASAVETFGIKDGRRLGAPQNLNWLIEKGIHAQQAQAIRDRYWPEP
jgi:tetratricopeptide (TPR) repeat protein